jgi:two-component system LytT family response regulator
VEEIMGNILIVEDDSIISNGLKKIVEEIDASSNIYSTGYAEEALKISKKIDIDVFLLDIQLEDYSGMELAKELRDISKYKLVPIVFITAIPTRELIAFKRIHCYDYIIKPFRKEEVVKVVTTLIKYGTNNTESKKISILQSGVSILIDEKDIIYIESNNRNLYVHTVEETMEIHNYWLKNMKKRLSDNFIKCHKSYIVNKDFITYVEHIKNLIYLKNVKEVIPIGRKYKEEILKEME